MGAALVTKFIVTETNLIRLYGNTIQVINFTVGVLTVVH